MPDELVKKALDSAKKLEKHSPVPKKDVVKLYKDGMKRADMMQKLLKPVWFVQDTDSPRKRKVYKPVKV